MIKRAKIEKSLQVLRKYKTYWLKFLRKEKILPAVNKTKTKKTNKLRDLSFEEAINTVELVFRCFEGEETLKREANDLKDINMIN